MFNARIFPNVTTSKKEFLNHISKVCTIDNIDREIRKEWFNHIETCNSDGHYFFNLIYIKFISAYLLLHEYIHHISQQLNTLTNSNSFWFIDDLNDTLYIDCCNIYYKFHYLFNRNNKIEKF